MEAQTKSPMVIDLDSSPPPSPTVVKTEPGTSGSSVNMNGTTNGMTNGTSSVPKSEPLPSTMTMQAPMQAAGMTQPGPAPAAIMGPDMTSGAGQNNMPATDGSSNELNFTNMTFSLAPPADEAPMSANPQDVPFDMSGFAPADGGNDMMSLDNSNFPDNNAQGNSAQQAQAGDGNAGDNGGSLDDFDWSINEGTGDGLDFDFSIGGEDTFNTLMNERDGEFGSMDPNGFDADPFNLDKNDGT